MNGINIILNGQIYHFDNADELIDILYRYADDITETSKDNTVFYDDEF